MTEADRKYFEFWAAATPVQRVARGLEIHEAVRQFYVGFVRAQHPEWSERRIALTAAKRLYEADDPAQGMLDKLLSTCE